MEIFMGILILVMALFLVVSILLQSSKDHRMSGTITGGAETFFGKQKGKTLDGILNKVTAVVVTIFFIAVLLLYIFQDNFNGTPAADNIVTPDDLAEVAEDVEGEDENTADEIKEDVEETEKDLEEVAEKVEEKVDEAVDNAEEKVDEVVENVDEVKEEVAE